MMTSLYLNSKRNISDEKTHRPDHRNRYRHRSFHAWAQPHKNAEFDHSAFDRILKRHVRNERVDYLAIARTRPGSSDPIPGPYRGILTGHIRSPGATRTVHQPV